MMTMIMVMMITIMVIMMMIVMMRINLMRKIKFAITQPIFKLGAPYFAW